MCGRRGQGTGDSSGFPGGCRAGPGRPQEPTKYSASPHLFTRVHTYSSVNSHREATGRGQEPVRFFFFFFLPKSRGDSDGSEPLFCVFPANQGFLPRSVGNDGTQQTLAGSLPSPPASSVGGTRLGRPGAPAAASVSAARSVPAVSSWLGVSGADGLEWGRMHGLSILGESLFKYLKISRGIPDFQPKSSFMLVVVPLLG